MSAPLFWKRKFEPQRIMTCVRRYLGLSVSPHDLEELMKLVAGGIERPLLILARPPTQYRDINDVSLDQSLMLLKQRTTSPASTPAAVSATGWQYSRPSQPLIILHDC